MWMNDLVDQFFWKLLKRYVGVKGTLLTSGSPED
jgi:hypothetical protein